MIKLVRLYLGWRLVQFGTWVSGLTPDDPDDTEPVERPVLRVVKDRA